MPDNLFDDVGPFADGLTFAQRGKLALRLTKACEVTPEANAARVMLGDPTNSARRDEARRLLNAMPALPRRYVLSRYAHLSRLSRD